MTRQTTITEELEKLQTIAPAGFALAFHIEYTRPAFLFQTYPEDWIREYSEKGLVMSDPTVHWGFEHEGTQRWSALVESDTAGVLSMAAAYGMKYGVTCAVEAGNTRSMCSFAREDREFTDEECAALLKQSEIIHAATADVRTLPQDLVAQLADRKVTVSQPGGQ